jgi:hypothetical protein
MADAEGGGVIIYHGTPLSPIAELMTLAGEFFCVPFPNPQDQGRCHEIGRGVMLDNGAFSAWRRGIKIAWAKFYAWVERWMAVASTWAVIPDVIQDGPEAQDALIAQWPHGTFGAPVWHMHEPIARLIRLIDTWPRVCIGSSAAYAVVLSAAWERRMDEAWNAIWAVFGRAPNLHMLRGTQLAGRRWPFWTADSTDLARNHNRPQNTARKMADRWNALAAQTAMTWAPRPEQQEFFAA